MCKTLFLSCIIALQAQISDQTGQSNCLRNNPGGLDGVFNMHNKQDNVWNLKPGEAEQLLRLFFTRFRKAHMRTALSPDQLRTLGDELADAKPKFKSDSQVYFLTQKGTKLNDVNNTHSILQKTYNALLEINRRTPGLVSGLYLRTNLELYSTQVKVFESVFGPSLRAEIPLGFFLNANFNNWNRTLYKKLQLITFLVYPRLLATPEDSADDVMKTCNALRKSATNANFTAEIFCRSKYPSNGIEANGLIGSVENFQRFWCRVLNGTFNDTPRIPVIMQTAFDDPPAYFKEKAPQTTLAERSTGWWRRISELTSDETAFVEKVDSIDELGGYTKETVIEIYYIIGLCGMAFLLLVMFLVILVLLYRTRSSIRTTMLDFDEIDTFRNGKPDHKDDFEGLNLPYDKKHEMKKSTFNIETSEQLGKGIQGTIYKGILTACGTNVAVKTTSGLKSSKSTKQMLSEIKIMAYVGTHRNILRMIGANTSELRQGTVYLILELCEMGSLQDVLRQDESINAICSRTGLSSIGRRDAFVSLCDKWSYQIACGMEHISSKHIVHGDLAARNVLITHDGIVKITDFGLSMKMYAYTEYVKTQREPLPWRWMAPEALRQMIFSTQSDVWAYGITLFEIYSRGILPYPGIGWDFSFIELLDSGYRNSQPEYSDLSKFSVMKECWNSTAGVRPSFSKLKEYFQQYQTEDVYLECTNA